MTISKTGVLLPAMLLGILMGGQPALAACFESGIGCTDDHYIPKSTLNALSCDALWTVRNTIYDENGYCFKTDRAKEVFSNAGCTVTNAGNLSFNKYERSNIDRIVSVEKHKGCR